MKPGQAYSQKAYPVVWLTLVLSGLVLSATAQSELTLSKEQAEASLHQLKLDIHKLQKSLEDTRSRFKNEQTELRKVDLEVQTNALKLRDLQAQRAEHLKELSSLEDERSAYLQRLGTRKAFLREQIVSAYQLGRESRLKLLLNQDNPAHVSRMLAYYDFFSRAQVGQIQELITALEKLNQIQSGIDEKLLALNQLEIRLEQSLNELKGRRSERELVLAGISGKIDTEQVRLQELTRDREDLEALLQRLSDALADIPTQLGEYQSPAQQRGSLPRPVGGRVLHAFGQPRAGGMNWSGWLIEAEAGSEIKAIAYGRIAYADWLRGYGLLIIIDHGGGFMSLYGNNESLLFEVGDWVQPGTVIGTVGAAPGSGQGLYFELRSNGKALDPAAWLLRK